MSVQTIARIRPTRVHAYRPQDWAEAAATDYWANWGNILMADAAALDLVANGWLTSGFSHTVGSAADFLASADVGTTGGLNFDTASDYIASPFIFGDYAHGQLVKGLLGYDPTTLNMECYARFAANNNEEDTGFGFVEAGATGAFAKADLMALITSDGTNFSLESAADADAGSTDNTTAHLFKITISQGTTDAIEWWIDGTSQGTIDLQTDLWPAAWVANTAAGGANDPVVSWVHIWYA